METAAINAKDDSINAGRKVYGVIGGIVTAQLGGNDIKALIEEGTVIHNRVTA